MRRTEGGLHNDSVAGVGINPQAAMGEGSCGGSNYGIVGDNY